MMYRMYIMMPSFEGKRLAAYKWACFPRLVVPFESFELLWKSTIQEIRAWLLTLYRL